MFSGKGMAGHEDVSLVKHIVIKGIYFFVGGFFEKVARVLLYSNSETR
jgi:hypothetical protein